MSGLVSLIVAGLCTPALALESLDDEGMAEVSGQDGLTVSVTEPVAGISVTKNTWITANRDLANQRGLEFSTINLKRLNLTVPLLEAVFDVGSPAGVPNASLEVNLARSRLNIGSVGLSGVSGSYGQYVIDAPTYFKLRNSRGFMDGASYGASTTVNVGAVDPSGWAAGSSLGAATPGQLYWRQGNNELSMGDYVFYFDMPNGRIAADASGIQVLSQPGTKVAFALSLDFMLDASASGAISTFAVTPADKSMLYWGWRGHWTDFNLRLRGEDRLDGGKGLAGALSFNYDPDFVWIIGEGGSTPFKIEFGNWTRLPGALNTADYSMPLVRLDQLDVGQGTTGLCWGSNVISATANGACSGLGVGPAADDLAAQPIKVRSAADAKAMAFSVRDMTLSAYSSTVDIIDHTVNPAKAPQRFNWALIYTFGNLDADIIVTPNAASDRMRLDLALTTQTHTTPLIDRWQYGTNFMIGDADSDFGIGLMGADVLMAVRNATLGLTSTGVRMDAPQVRYQLRGMIAGGGIPNMPIIQQMAYLDMNLEADRLMLNLAPASAGQYLQYYGFINIVNSNIADFSNPVPGSGNHAHDDGTYFSLAEPNLDRLGVDFRFADITGPLEFTDGKLDLQGDSDATLKLTISNNIRVGTSAFVPCSFGVACTPAAATNPLRVGRLEFGGKNLGAIVMPAGIIRSQISLMPEQL